MYFFDHSADKSFFLYVIFLFDALDIAHWSVLQFIYFRNESSKVQRGCHYLPDLKGKQQKLNEVNLCGELYHKCFDKISQYFW